MALAVRLFFFILKGFFGIFIEYDKWGVMVHEEIINRLIMFNNCIVSM